MMAVLRKSVLAILIGLVGFGGVFVLSARPSTAQLTCDNPPVNVVGLQQTWDKTDFCRFLYEGIFDEIISGGVPRDGIPPIDNPAFESIEAASAWLQPQSPVIAVELNGVARAYPLAILTWHEIVNDTLGETPVAVTFCPLCNSAVVYVRQVDGVTLRFGVSGLLRNSDLVMWDDVTQSWWQQLTGEAIVGSYVGTTLEALPALVVGFGEFVAQYPAGEVLAIPTGVSRSYGSNPYTLYDSNEAPFLFRGEPDERLFAVERVLGAVIAGEAVAYPFPLLAEQRVVNDTVGGQAVVVFWQTGATSALDQRDIDASRDVGMAAMYSRVLDDGRVLTFSLNGDGAIVDDATGSTWNVFGTATAGELAGTQLFRQLAGPHFWFAWAAFFPETAVFGLEE